MRDIDKRVEKVETIVGLSFLTALIIMAILAALSLI